MRSMTLMPVSNISSSVDCSSKDGAGRWMGLRLVAFTGPISSTGSPMTFSTRPRVPAPTGTVMGCPVSMAFMPRTMPSVGSMRDAAHAVLAEVLLDLGDHVDGHAAALAVVLDADRVVDRRHLAVVELDVHHGPDDLDDPADVLCCHIPLLPYASSADLI